MASEKERRQRNPDWHKETGTHVNEDGEEESYEFWTKDDSEMDDDDSYTFFHKNDGDDDGDGEFHTPKEDPSEFYTPKEGPSDRGNMGGGSTKSGNDQSFESQAACIARVRRDFHKATLSGENAVKKYYRKTLMPLHPDRTSQLPEAERLAREECFKELGNLYSTYMDSRGKK